MSYTSTQNLSPTFQNINCTGNLIVAGSITADTTTYENLDVDGNIIGGGTLTTAGKINTIALYADTFNNLTCNSKAYTGTETITQNVFVGAASAQTATFTGTIQNNTALGFNTLTSINDGSSNNTAIGANSMQGNISGLSNTAIGYASLAQNTTGENNTVVGSQSLSANTIGNNNVSIGFTSLITNTTGSSNVSIGTNSLYDNITGNQNVSIGTAALQNQTSGVNNIAIGFQAGAGNDTILPCTTGSNNTFLGVETGFAAAQQNYSTAIGYGSTITADHQVVLGTVDETVICPNGLMVDGAATIVNGFTLGSPTVAVQPSFYVIEIGYTAGEVPAGFFPVNINGVAYKMPFY